ncbi:MAG: hypothetical protein NZ700_01790 [Gemmataceae bacterium]|nr:hypothetical protein [Gemmataceae bacterium]MDW8264611.1 hypothetical protein [Gemmataceae bacterium]
MSRLHVLLLVGVLVGCQTAAERMPIKPLPEEGQPWPYAELLARARLQAAAANEAFYVNRWADLEDAARGLEQTGRFMLKAEDIPPRLKDTLPKEIEELSKDCLALRDAARNQDVPRSNELMQKINLRVRMLRIEQ